MKSWKLDIEEVVIEMNDDLINYDSLNKMSTGTLVIHGKSKSISPDSDKNPKLVSHNSIYAFLFRYSVIINFILILSDFLRV